MNLFLVLPAYNEESALPRLFRAAEQTLGDHALQIIVVDDGSADRTAEIANEWRDRGVELVVHPVNRGLGETIRDGLRHAAERAQPEDAIVAMDADNTHPVDLIPRMLDLLNQGHDLVIASRFRRGAKVVGLSSFRRLMTVGARILYKGILPIPGVRDYTCGFRVYRAALVQRAFAKYGDSLVTEQGFTCMAEILVKISSLKPSIVESPMVLRYDLKGGASKMPVARTLRTSLKLLLSRRLSGSDAP